jgi:GT2 family glycosyltransferase
MTVLPTFSIVVPTYRRLERLAVCLRSLATLDYPRDRFEVIVVDDGGNLPLPRIPAPIDVVLLTQLHAGPATARNRGAARARGKYLAFTDDDCRPDPGWLRAMAARVAQAPDHAIGGRTINALPHNPYSTATQLLVDFLSEWHAGHEGVAFFASNNLVVPADLFLARGGFDADFRLAAGEDREFCHRWGRSGGRFTYALEALVRHEHHLDLGSFWRQHVTYGRGALHFHRILARAEHGPPASTPLSFYPQLVTYPLQAPHERRLLLTALLLLAQVATVAGYWRERLRWQPGPALGDRDQRK